VALCASPLDGGFHTRNSASALLFHRVFDGTSRVLFAALGTEVVPVLRLGLFVRATVLPGAPLLACCCIAIIRRVVSASARWCSLCRSLLALCSCSSR